jgi:hypothetical protein
MVANALYLLAWLASCGSHPWVSKVSAILWICCSAAAALALWPGKKDKSYVCPSKVLFWRLDHSKRPFFNIYLVSWGNLLRQHLTFNCIKNSNNDANTNPSNQYEIRRDDLKKFATLSCANAQYSYWPQLPLTLCCQTEM